jgi:uncharacterized protein (DUF305 family)
MEAVDRLYPFSRGGVFTSPERAGSKNANGAQLMKRVFQTISLAMMVAAGGFAYAGSAELSVGSKLLEEANGAMHQSMSMDMTGDVDVDFMLSMIPHHEGAVDMAKIVIEHGADPEVRKLAEAVVKAQESEIAFMKDWLARKGVAAGHGAH